MKKVLFILVLASFSTCFTQQKKNIVDTRINTIGDPNTYGPGLWIKSSTIKNVKGSPYLFDNWINFATIYSSEGKMFRVRNINYDTKTDRFVAKVSLDSVYEFDSQYLKKIRLNNKVFTFIQSANINSYFELIVNAKGKQILKKSRKIIKEGKRDPFTNATSADYYVLKEKYFFRSNEESIKELKLKKKSFLKLFGDESYLVKKIISKNNLSLKKDADLVKIFNLYERL